MSLGTVSVFQSIKGYRFLKSKGSWRGEVKWSWSKNHSGNVNSQVVNCGQAIFICVYSEHHEASLLLSDYRQKLSRVLALGFVVIKMQFMVLLDH